jgi:hypothetical protein
MRVVSIAGRPSSQQDDAGEGVSPVMAPLDAADYLKRLLKAHGAQDAFQPSEEEPADQATPTGEAMELEPGRGLLGTIPLRAAAAA